VTDEAIAVLAPRIGTRAACAASGVPQATWYRRHRISPPAPKAAPVPHADRVQPRALAPAERTAILDVLHSGRFADTAPAEVWATLLDEGTYLGSVSTYYRVLREAGESRERRAQATQTLAAARSDVGVKKATLSPQPSEPGHRARLHPHPAGHPAGVFIL
jgi:putative transposase